jgi:DNA polymerase I-like protein with 3'-5' exonuclease and polymerase domains
MAKISRTQAKTINLGLFYGMGKIKLQAELG